MNSDDTANSQGNSAMQSSINIRREVVVIMSFGGGDPNEERELILHFMRIKHILENYAQHEATPESIAVHYRVSVAYTLVGAFSEESLEKIVEADILIALITGVNVNVIFELAVRNLMKTETVLVVNGDPQTLLPYALQTMAAIPYDNPKFKGVHDTISNIAANKEAYPLSWSEVEEIPDKLKVAIRDEDKALMKAFSRVLFRLETDPPDRPPVLRKYIEDFSPENVLGSWITFVPWSVVRIHWRKRYRKNQYRVEDMLEEPIVCTANEPFKQLFDLQDIPQSNKTNQERLTSADLLNHVKDYVDSDHMEKFIADQQRLTQRVVFEERNATATVPLQFNARHESFKNRVFLPCLVGSRTEGSTHVPHTTYLLVVYIEDFWPIDYLHLKKEQKDVTQSSTETV